MSDEMKRELHGVKADIGEVKKRLGRIEANLGGVTSGIDELKSMVRRIASTLTKTNADVNEFKEYAHENFVTKGEFHSRMDGLSGKVDDMRFDWSKHQVRLDDHDKRMTKLEGRRA
jgi:archaellum component FlaC